MLLQSQLQEIESYFPYLDKQNPKVSASTVGWQLDHSLRVVVEVSQSLLASDPKAYKKSFNFSKIIVLWLGKIPRGKAKAPKTVNNTKPIVLEELKALLQQAQTQLREVDTLSDTSNFEHPYFGMLNLKETLKFLTIHTEHHLKIVRDILK